MNRRDLLKIVGLTAVSGAGISLTSGCGSLLGKQRTNALVFVSDGGEYQAAQRDSWITPFSRSRPDLNVVEDVPKSYARLQAMVSSENVMWDLMTATGDFGYGVDRDYLVDFAGRDLPLDQLHPEYVGESRVGHAVFSNVLAYRTDLLGGKTPQAGRTSSTSTVSQVVGDCAISRPALSWKSPDRRRGGPARPLPPRLQPSLRQTRHHQRPHSLLDIGCAIGAAHLGRRGVDDSNLERTCV